MTAYDDGLTPDVLEAIAYEAIAQGDFESVGHAITLLTVRDSRRVNDIYAVLKAAIIMGRRPPSREAS